MPPVGAECEQECEQAVVPAGPAGPVISALYRQVLLNELLTQAQRDQLALCEDQEGLRLDPEDTVTRVWEPIPDHASEGEVRPIVAERDHL